MGGFQLRRDRVAERYVKLIGIEHHSMPLPIQIRHPPPPHFASDPDPHFIPGGGIGKVLCQRPAINEKRAQNDDRGGRKSVVKGKSGSVREERSGWRSMKKKKK